MKGFCGECDRRYACDIDPDKCDEWPDPVPMTNGDRIRASNEKLKEWYCKNRDCGKCDFCHSFGCTLDEWLQQPAEEG